MKKSRNPTRTEVDKAAPLRRQPATVKKRFARARALRKALRESGETFRVLAEQSPSMIWINQGGRIVYANRRCEQIMGYSREELYAPGFDFRRLVAPEYQALTAQNFARHAQGLDVDPYEYVVLSKQGKRIEASIATKLIAYNGAPAILGTVTDISHIKKTEAALKKSQTELLAQRKALEEKNAALREVLAQIEADKATILERVAANVDRLLMPIVRKLKLESGPVDRRQVERLENNIREIASEFGLRLDRGTARLSPREMEICDLARNGLSSKDMAELLRVSVRTVHTLRQRIRKKLALRREGVNLVTYLQTLAHPEHRLPS